MCADFCSLFSERGLSARNASEPLTAAHMQPEYMSVQPLQAVRVSLEVAMKSRVVRLVVACTAVLAMGAGAFLNSMIFSQTRQGGLNSVQTVLQRDLLQQGKSLPVFLLKDANGVYKQNYDWEYTEQLLAAEHVLPSDRVLMIGGNIGSACIAVDKILATGSGSQACVEPNPALHAALEANRALNHARFRVVRGVIGDAPLEMHACDGSGTGTCGTTSTGRRRLVSVPNTKLATLEKEMFGAAHAHAPEKDRHSRAPSHAHAGNGSTPAWPAPVADAKAAAGFNFLLADCEGCLCFFLRDHPAFVHQLRGVIMELDGDKQCIEREIVPKFESAGLTRVAEPTGVGQARSNTSVAASAVWIRKAGRRRAR